VPAEGHLVFLLVFAVPALVVVVLGYVVGHALWSWVGGLIDDALGTSLADGAEPAGWLTGTLLLVGVVLAVLRRRRSKGRLHWS
jgi:MYXO-CTERM domain-containing protein